MQRRPESRQLLFLVIVVFGVLSVLILRESNWV